MQILNETADAPVVLGVRHDVSWLPTPNTATVTSSTHVPEPMTSAFCFITRPTGAGTELLLVDVISRGWDLPGGRREPGENLLDVVVRECAEEAGITIAPDAITVLGHVRLHTTAAKPSGYRFPHPTTFMGAVHIAVQPDVTVSGTSVPDEIRAHTWAPLTPDVTALCGDRVWAAFLPHLPGAATKPAD